MGDASAAANAADFIDGQLLDPISEEDDESHGAAPRTPCTRKRGGGALYHKLPNEEEELETEADPLLILLHQHQEAGDVPSLRRKLRGAGAPPQTSAAEVAPDKKDSSDSGARLGDSAPSDQERALLRETEGAPRKLDATARMSICSEAASEVSLMSSTPDGAGVVDMRLTSDTGNLNRGLATAAAATAVINNNNNPGDSSNTNANNSRQRSAAADPSPVIIITPGTTAAATIHNQNLRTISMGDERESIL